MFYTHICKSLPHAFLFLWCFLWLICAYHYLSSLYGYSEASISKLALPPAAVVLIEVTRSQAKAVEIVRASGFGAGSRQALAAERLHADNSADERAVDVEIADMKFALDAVDGGLDTAVQAAGQAEAGGVDLGDKLAEILGLVAQDMQDRAKDFVGEE